MSAEQGHNPTEQYDVQRDVQNLVEAQKEIEASGEAHDALRDSMTGLVKALSEARQAVEQAKFNSPEEKEQAKGKVAEELKEALVALRDALSVARGEQDKLIDTTRYGVEQLGLKIKDAPPQQNWLARLVPDAKFDEWIDKLDKNDPRGMLESLLHETIPTADTIQSEQLSDAALRSGIKLVRKAQENSKNSTDTLQEGATKVAVAPKQLPTYAEASPMERQLGHYTTE